MKGDGQKSPHRVFHSPACEFLEYYTTAFEFMQVFFENIFSVQNEKVKSRQNPRIPKTASKEPYKDITATKTQHKPEFNHQKPE